MTAFDAYWPMEDGPGRLAGLSRWRSMARLWCDSGVVQPALSPTPGELHPLSVWGVDGNEVNVAPGGCWVDGFFGANMSTTRMTMPGAGLMVARLDPVAEEISLVFKAGAGPGDVTQDADGVFEIPLGYWDGAGQGQAGITDLRQYVPGPPAIGEVPSSVPTGRRAELLGPDTQFDSPQGRNDVVVAYPGAWGWVTPGRSYRFSFTVNPLCVQQSTNTPMRVYCYVRDEAGMRFEENYEIRSVSGGAGQVGGLHVPRGMSVLVRDVRPDAVAVVSAEVNDAVPGILRWAPYSAHIACADAGVLP